MGNVILTSYDHSGIPTRETEAKSRETLSQEDGWVPGYIRIHLVDGSCIYGSPEYLDKELPGWRELPIFNT